MELGAGENKSSNICCLAEPEIIAFTSPAWLRLYERVLYLVRNNNFYLITYNMADRCIFLQ